MKKLDEDNDDFFNRTTNKRKVKDTELDDIDDILMNDDDEFGNFMDGE